MVVLMDQGERGVGSASAIMAMSCSVVMGKGNVVGWTGPSFRDSRDMGDIDIF